MTPDAPANCQHGPGPPPLPSRLPDAKRPSYLVFPTQKAFGFPPIRLANDMRKLLPICILVIGGCAEGERTPEWTGTVRDSAGIQIVENPSEGVWDERSAWTLEVDLRIGGIEGKGPYEFSDLTGLTVDGDGRIYLLDQQAREVRIFNARGEHVETLGREGSGPGELGPALPGVLVRDGAVLVLDLSNHRLTVFPSDRGAPSSTSLDLSQGFPVRVDLGAEGGVVAQLRGMAAEGIESHAGGDPIVRLSEEGAPTDTVLVLPRGTTMEFDGGTTEITMLAPEPVWDMARDGRLIWAMNNAYGVEVLRDGRVERVILRAVERQPVTVNDERLFRLALEQLLLGAGAPPTVVQALLGQMAFADFYPALGAVLAGPDGSTWVQGIRTAEDVADSPEDFNPQNLGPPDLGAPDWSVFDAEGRFLGVVMTPLRFKPFLCEGDFVYGIGLDEYDVPEVLRLRVLGR